MRGKVVNGSIIETTTCGAISIVLISDRRTDTATTMEGMRLSSGAKRRHIRG
jgi:hypothetical protein